MLRSRDCERNKKAPPKRGRSITRANSWSRSASGLTRRVGVWHGDRQFIANRGDRRFEHRHLGGQEAIVLGAHGTAQRNRIALDAHVHATKATGQPGRTPWRGDTRLNHGGLGLRHCESNIDSRLEVSLSAPGRSRIAARLPLILRLARASAARTTLSTLAGAGLTILAGLVSTAVVLGTGRRVSPRDSRAVCAVHAPWAHADEAIRRSRGTAATAAPKRAVAQLESARPTGAESNAGRSKGAAERSKGTTRRSESATAGAAAAHSTAAAAAPSAVTGNLGESGSLCGDCH